MWREFGGKQLLTALAISETGSQKPPPSNTASSCCTLSWNHLLQTQLPRAVPSPGSHAAHNLVLPLRPYSVFWDTTAFPQRMPREPQATNVLCSAFQEHKMRIYMCSAGSCNANRPFT